MILRLPLSGIPISQPFGMDNTNHPQRNKFYLLFGGKHPGVDFAVPIGTPIHASYPGIVVRREFHQGMGNVLGTRYGNIIILYAHLSEFKLELGEIVKQKQLVGLSGNTGSATTGPHLHFEMRDLTKSSLPEMVFDPPFGNKLTNLKPEFTYTVNNTNTPKTLASLARLYFGEEKYWSKLKAANPELKAYSKTQLLPQGKILTIPNY